MKKLVLAAAIASGLSGVAATPAFAEITYSANVSVVSEYTFRGISQSQEEPALQGGFDVDFGNGFYIGNWNSNVDFGNDGVSLEMDFYGGYAGEYNGISYDVGLLQYYYPVASGFNTDVDALELYGSVGVYGFTLGVAYSLDDVLFGVGAPTDQDGATYVSIGYDYDFGNGFSAGASYGMSNFEEAAGQDLDYDDYSIYAAYALNDTFAVGLTFTDVDEDGISNGQDSTTVLSLSASF